MIQLISFEHCPFCKRVELFCSYKNLPIEKKIITPKDLPAYGHAEVPIVIFEDGSAYNGSIALLREIEYRFPHPIGFVGPVEGLVQSTSMIMNGIPGYFDCISPKSSLEDTEKQTIFQNNILPLLEDIIEKVENDYFLMGPTFSVADCILCGDLFPFFQNNIFEMPEEIQRYYQRVLQKCRV